MSGEWRGGVVFVSICEELDFVLSVWLRFLKVMPGCWVEEIVESAKTERLSRVFFSIVLQEIWWPRPPWWQLGRGW